MFELGDECIKAWADLLQARAEIERLRAVNTNLRAALGQAIARAAGKAT